MNAIKTADHLVKLSEGLLFPSESEYALEKILWTAAALTPETILKRSQKPADTPIKAIALDDFFAPVVTEQDWHDDEDRITVQRFRDLQTAIATLENVQVFRVGQIEIDVYIVGAIGSDVVGLKTTVIET